MIKVPEVMELIKSLVVGASICSQVDDWFSVKRLVFHLFDVFPSNDWISSQCRLGDWKSSHLTKKCQNDGKPVI